MAELLGDVVGTYGGLSCLFLTGASLAGGGSSCILFLVLPLPFLVGVAGEHGGGEVKMTEESNEGGVDTLDARKDVMDGMYSSMSIEQSSIGTDIETSKTAEFELNTVDLGFSACFLFLAPFLLAGSISAIVSSVTLHGFRCSITLDEAIYC